MREVTGSTFPNDGREWWIEQMLRDVAGPEGTTTYIHYQVCDDPWSNSGPSGDNCGVYGVVRGGRPSKSIPPMREQAFHVRFYDRGDAHRDVAFNHPDVWAERVAHMLTSTRYGWCSIDAGGNERIDWRIEDLTEDPYVVVSGYNEPNLEWGVYIGRTPDAAFYREWAERELAFFQALDKLLPSRKCLWASSAPAYGHDAYPDDPDSEWPIIQATGLLDYVDLVQLHVYAVKDVDPQSGPGGANEYWHALRPWRAAGYDVKREGTNRPADRGGVLTQFGSRYRYFVSEWNTFVCNIAAETNATIGDHRAMLSQFAATPAIVAATSFIWISGGEHGKNIIALNEPLRTWHERNITVNVAAEWPVARWKWMAVEPEPEQPPAQGGKVHVTEGVPDFAALRPWPYTWNQLADGTIDGRPDEGRLNNCGPESLAECMFYITGDKVAFSADEIHDQIVGEGGSRYTTVAELSQWCQWHGIEVEPLSGDANTLLQPKVRWAIDNGRPIIVLFFFDLDKLTGGHFCPVYAYDTGGCWRANPWGGKSEFLTWPEFERAQSYGTALILHATRS